MPTTTCKVFMSQVTTSSLFVTFSFVTVVAGAIAAYNAGDGRVDSYESVDAKTTGGDYSNDVIARAQWYKTNLRF